jgi:hypothetical protein
MAPDEVPTPLAPGAPQEHCAECGKALSAVDRVAAGDRVFCTSCHAMLRLEIEGAVQAMSEDINYANAALGAVLGGAVGVLAWWGFTVATGWSVGLIAVGLGWAVGAGTVRLSGGKRSQGLQILSAAVACASWVVASYLVNMTFINRAMAKEGGAGRVPVPPTSLEMAGTVLGAGFGLMDVVFLAIMVWEAWKWPRPIRLAPPPVG